MTCSHLNTKVEQHLARTVVRVLTPRELLVLLEWVHISMWVRGEWTELNPGPTHKWICCACSHLRWSISEQYEHRQYAAKVGQVMMNESACQFIVYYASALIKISWSLLWNGLKTACLMKVDQRAINTCILAFLRYPRNLDNSTWP